MKNRDPIVRNVPQEGPTEQTQTVIFDAKAQILSLLQDESLMQPENLVLNTTNFYEPYQSKGKIDEILDGSWYQECVKTYNSNEFCVPLVLYMDKTGGDALNQRYPVFPLIVTTALFTRSVRMTSVAWRQLGFISNLDVFMSKAQRSQLPRGANCRNFHEQLKTILQPLTELQETGLLFDLKIGQSIKSVTLRFPICCILGDGQMGDAITGRYENHSRGIQRIHRSCHCMPKDAANTEKVCTFLLEENIQLMNVREDEESLHNLSQHKCDLAFFGMDFGGCPFGVFSAQPPCILHALCEGLVNYLVQSFLDKLLPWQKSLIDAKVTPWLRGFRQSIREIYPTSNFTRGITSLKLVTADEKIGILFSLALLCSSNLGRKILFEPPPRKSTNMTDLIHKQYLHMFEAVLCLEQTLSRTEGGFWKLEDRQQGERCLQQALKSMVDVLIKECPREEGNGWHLAKIHDVLSFPRYITRLGSPANFNAALGESLLRPLGKHFVPNAQFRRSEFTKQLAWRVSEQAIVKVALQKFGDCINHNAKREKVTGYSRIRTSSDIRRELELKLSLRGSMKILFRLGEQGAIHTSFFTDSKSSRLKLHSTIEEYIRLYMLDNGYTDLTGYTELRINNKIYRCHPDYWSGGPWYDWAFVAFLNMNNDEQRCPCKILLFLENREMNQNQDGVTSTPLIALVHCTGYSSTSSSVLFHRWHLETRGGRRRTSDTLCYPLYRTVPVDSIEEHCYCFEENPGIHCSYTQVPEILVVVPRREWPGKFYDTLQDDGSNNDG